MSVELICLGDGKAPKRELLNGVDVLRVSVRHRRGSKLAYIYQYFAFILISTAILALRSLTRRYDLVYVHNMPDVLVLSALVPKAFGARIILDLHDPMPELMTTIFRLDQKSLSVRLIKRLERWSIAHTDLVLTVNVACKRIFGSRSCPPAKIGVVMNSPDEEIFRFSTPRPDSINRAPEKPFVIMYHGAMVERNGVDLAVEAVLRARECVPNAELRIYGPTTPFLERVMELTQSKAANGAVRYFGPKRLEEIVQAIDECDIGIIPNHRNAFTEINTPTRIFEYLALGKPVIAPRTPGIEDYFGKDALLFFEAGNSEDLARAIEYACSHSTEMVAITKRGQQVYQSHTWEQQRQILVSLVSELLHRDKVGEIRPRKPGLLESKVQRTLPGAGEKA